MGDISLPTIIMCWYRKYLQVFEKPPGEAPIEIIEKIKSNLAKIQSSQPLATIAIIAYNEESRLLSCIWSLSESLTNYPVEIIGIDNNSCDSTAAVYEMVGLPFFKELKMGPGNARQRGLDEAKGRYILCIDSDTIYPNTYVNEMIKELEKPGVVAVSASYSYVPDKNYPRFWMSIYERLRDVHLFFLSFKNPVWCVRGAVFGHSVPLAREVGGYRVHLTRGEDGGMAYDLMPHGKIKFKRGNRTRAFTCTKSLGADGHILKAFFRRVLESIIGVWRYFFFTGDSEGRPEKEQKEL